MKKLLLIATLSLSSVSAFAVKPSLALLESGEKRPRTLSGTGQRFCVFDVIGDGNCGFYALETTREEIKAAVLADLDNMNTQNLLRDEAKNYFWAADANNIHKYEFVGKELIRDFLLKRYFPEQGTVITQDHHLETLFRGQGSGLLDWIAHHKKFNVRVWQWNKNSNPKDGVKFVKVVNVNPAFRTIDIVINNGHYKRLVLTNDKYTAENETQALKTESEWKTWKDRVAKSNDDDLALAIQISMGDGNIAASSSTSSAAPIVTKEEEAAMAKELSDSLASSQLPKAESSSASAATSSNVDAPADVAPEIAFDFEAAQLAEIMEATARAAQAPQLSSEERALQDAIQRSLKLK